MADLLRPIHQRSGEMYWGAVRLASGNFAVGTPGGKALVLDPTDLKLVGEIKSSFLTPPRTANVHVARGEPGELLVFFYLEDPYYRAFQVHDEETLVEKALHEYKELHTVLCVADGVGYGVHRRREDGRVDFVAVRLADAQRMWGVLDVKGIEGAAIDRDKVVMLGQEQPALKVYGAGGGTFRWGMTTAGRALCLAVSGGMAFVGTELDDLTGEMLAYDLDARELRWSRPLPAPCGGVQVIAGTVYARTDKGPNLGDGIALATFAAATGEPGFEFFDGNRLMGEVGVDDGLVLVPISFFRNRDAGDIVGLAADTGREVFRSELGAYSGTFAFPEGDRAFVGTYRDLAVLDLRRHWAIPLNASARVRAAVDGGQVVVSTVAGDSWLIDAAEGITRWGHDGPASSNAAPAMLGERVFAATGNKLFALDRAEGHILWEHEADDIITGELAARNIGEDVVAFGTRSGAITLLAARDGEQRASFDIGAALTAPIIIGDQFLITAGNDGRLLATGYDGSPVWPDVGGQHEIRGLRQLPGKLVVADAGGTVKALSLADGKAIWTRRLDRTIDARGIAPVGGQRFAVTDMAGDIYLIDGQGGAVRWRSNPLGLGTLTPVRVGDSLVAVTAAGKVAIIDPATGNARRRYALGTGVVAPVGGDGSMALVSDDRGRLVRLVV